MALGKNIRIKDIARLAGVSAGTVDRVLHNRGRVSEEALQKITAVMEQIDKIGHPGIPHDRRTMNGRDDPSRVRNAETRGEQPADRIEVS